MSPGRPGYQACRGLLRLSAIRGPHRPRRQAGADGERAPAPASRRLAPARGHPALRRPRPLRPPARLRRPDRRRGVQDPQGQGLPARRGGRQVGPRGRAGGPAPRQRRLAGRTDRRQRPGREGAPRAAGGARPERLPLDRRGPPENSPRRARRGAAEGGLEGGGERRHRSPDGRDHGDGEHPRLRRQPLRQGHLAGRLQPASTTSDLPLHNRRSRASTRPGRPSR